MKILIQEADWIKRGQRQQHPRSRKRMQKLQSNARLVLTDSGGVQEGTCIPGVLILRDNTGRPETVEAGANMLAGTEMIVE